MWKTPEAAVPHLCRQVAAHSIEMGAQGYSGEPVPPVAGGRSGRSRGGSLQPGSGACRSWGSRRWGSRDDCRARRFQLEETFHTHQTVGKLFCR